MKTKTGYSPVHADTGKKLTKAEEARLRYEAWVNDSNEKTYADLIDFQKKAKKGWAVLGFTQEEIDLIKS